MHSVFIREVLIVDDEEHIRNLLSDLFSSNGYKTITADNGKKALEIFKDKMLNDRPCSLLLTDFNMPEMDGLDLTKKIRSLDMPLIIIGMSVDDKESDFLTAGADYFLSKPFYINDIKHILNSISFSL